jgi:hypothetical protein
LSPGQSFEKTWRLRNSGTCTWSQDYELIFVSGNSLGGPASVPLPRSVAPGETVDLAVALTAPTANGTYEGRWLLRDEKGASFGVGNSADRTFWVRVAVGATPTPASAVAPWRGEYFGTRDLSGNSVLVRDDPALNFNWDAAAPAAGLPSDGFSVRWTRTVPLQEGTYHFYVGSDDGVRVWLDGELIIDQWHEAANVLYVVERTVGPGAGGGVADHTLRVEYYENIGTAHILFWWQRQGAFTHWRGAYFPTVDLTGAPSLVRNDTAINFNWGSGAPLGALPADGFSVRWVRTLAFEEGLYRFRVVVDHGARLWVDDTLVIDTWTDGGRRDVRADQRVSAGDHVVRVEFYERTGDALIQVSWEKLDAYPDWRGEYWSNPLLSGSPVLVRNDMQLDFDWRAASPAANLPVDNFSARWTRRAQFDTATYRFRIIADDGARLWVDDQLLIDAWRDGSARELTLDVPLAQGEHRLRVEYYERTGEAQIRVWWEKLTVASYPDWKGEYWSNQRLSGNPALVRNDKDIDFRWGAGVAGAGLPADRFSVRWSRQVTFESGLYRFSAWADDGIRFYLDGELLIDEWHDSSGDMVYVVEKALGGTHTLTVEYYEDSGAALVKFSRKLIGERPVPTATPTMPPTPESTPTASPTPEATPTAEFTPTSTPEPE